MVIKVVNNMMTLPFEDEVIYEGCFEMSFGEVFAIIFDFHSYGGCVLSAY